MKFFGLDFCDGSASLPNGSTGTPLFSLLDFRRFISVQYSL